MSSNLVHLSHSGRNLDEATLKLFTCLNFHDFQLFKWIPRKIVAILMRLQKDFGPVAYVQIVHSYLWWRSTWYRWRNEHFLNGRSLHSPSPYARLTCRYDNVLMRLRLRSTKVSNNVAKSKFYVCLWLKGP